MHAHSSGGAAIPRDALSEVLRDLRIADGTYGRCRLTRPWGIDFPKVEQARFHFVVEGECWLLAPQRGWIKLETGDVAFLPRGTRHELASLARGRTKPLDSMPLEQIGDHAYQMCAGGTGAPTLLVCCSVTFDEPAVHPLLDLMPPVLLARGRAAPRAASAETSPRDAASRDSVSLSLLDAMADEVRAPRMGAATVMTRLADVVIARLVRDFAESRAPETQGWLAAIRDPQIGRALVGIHRRPGDSWSVDSLARVARMSRSVFSERFTLLVGVSPARYLARWRMHVASGWLRKDRLTVAEAASRLGYDSEAAFSRAFKRFTGIPPSAARRAAMPG